MFFFIPFICAKYASLQRANAFHTLIMTGNGHIELFKVTSYNFHPQEHA